jgi:8-oxo-dGTP pyrophosphatase MutT (NUDIX family)
VPKRTRAKRERSAGGVVVRTIDGVPHVLLIRDPYRNWGLPKGHIERDEDPGVAALREISEETGLDDLTLGPALGTVDWHFRQGGVLIHKFCDFFLVASRDGEAIPEREEGITECRWHPVADAIATITYDNAREIVRIAAEKLRDDGPGFPPWNRPEPPSTH